MADEKKTPTLDFNALVLSLGSSVIVHLGEAPDPTSGQKREKPDFSMAQQSVDLLAMLQEKTRGNLTNEETTVLRNTLSNLQMAYVEVARQALGRALVRPLLSEDGGLRVLKLDHSIEEELTRAFSPQLPQTVSSGLQPSFVRRILDSLRQLAGEQVAQTAPVLLCSTPARFHLRRLLEPFLPKVVVLSPLEIPPMVPVQSLGTVR